jgi:hypothetical protein
MTGALGLAARNDLHAALAGGTLHPPAPAVCLLDGLPPRRRPPQGRCGTRCALFLASLRDRLRRPLTRPPSSRPASTRSPGAGEDLSPTSSQEVAPVGTQQPGTVYLIHFQRPYKHARHYCGWVHSPTFLEPRLGAHRDGAGARLMAVITAAGIGWELVHLARQPRLRAAPEASRRSIPSLPDLQGNRHLPPLAPFRAPRRGQHA